MSVEAHASEPARTGLLLFLLSESLAFVGLLAAEGALRIRAPVWPSPGTPPLPVVGLAGVTALLVLAWAAFDRAAAEERLAWHLGGVGFGLAFLLAQATLNAQLWWHGLTWTAGPSAQGYLAITAFHGLHVLAGCVVPPRAGRAPWLARYWTFLLVTQLVIFTFVELL